MLYRADLRNVSFCCCEIIALMPSFENIHKFTLEARGLLFPVVTVWDVTGPNVICNIIEEVLAFVG